MFSARASNLYFRLVQGLQSRKSCVLRVSGCLDIPNQGRKGMFCACHRPREPTAVKIVTLLCNQIRQFCNLIRSVSSVLTIKNITASLFSLRVQKNFSLLLFKVRPFFMGAQDHLLKLIFYPLPPSQLSPGKVFAASARPTADSK